MEFNIQDQMGLGKNKSPATASAQKLIVLNEGIRWHQLQPILEETSTVQVWSMTNGLAVLSERNSESYFTNMKIQMIYQR